MILSFLFYAFLVYLTWKLVFNFIIPIYRTTRTVKKGFRDMQERMKQHTEQYEQPRPNAQRQTTVSKPDSGDYIEFEEIK